jgi:hypothetical protein
MKNTIKTNTNQTNAFSIFLKAEIAKKQLKNVKGGATDIVIEDVIDS